MAVLDFMPHRLEWLLVEEGKTLDNGDYVAGAQSWQGSLPCSAVARGEADRQIYADGEARPYSYVVTLSVGVREFAVGERVRLRLLGGSPEEYSVQGFQRYQHQTKLWL